MASITPLLRLPSELILQILSLFSASELAITSRTCRQLRRFCLDDNLWRSYIQVNVPGLTVTAPSPCATFRDLYLSMIPFWHLPRGKFWFSSKRYTGRLMVIRYSQARQRIEAYVLTAKRENLTQRPWSWNPLAIIHRCDPIVRLEENDTAFVLTAGETGAMSYSLRAIEGISTPMRREIRGEWQQTIYVPRQVQWIKHTLNVPIWPPLSLPAQARTYHTRENHSTKLPKLEELSESTFMSTEWFCQDDDDGSDSSGGGTCNSSMYGTLPTEVYTPTAKKPWRGIYCGDYAGHGCEFIVVMQPDDPDSLPESAWLELMNLGSQQSQPDAWYQMLKKQAPLSSSSPSSSGVTPPPCAQSIFTETANSSESLQRDGEAAQAMKNVFSQRRPSNDKVGTEMNSQNVDGSSNRRSTRPPPSIHQGCIKAIKLTGDPNVPRGEITFVAPDISDIGLMRIADDDDFQGARVVRSVGHIAEEGFRDDQYIPSQLILVSHDQIAQYWEDFRHVSFYHRIDIDALVRTG